MDKNKVLELESLRGIAALLVILFHYFAWNPFVNTPLITNSYLMVELFFLLSGFLIWSAYGGKINSTRDLLKFQFLRLGRLYPLHLLFLVLFLFRELLKLASTQHFGAHDIRVMPFGENSFQAFIEQIFLLQAVLPNGNAYTFNVPAWSISVEFFNYLIFGVIILFFKPFKVLIFTLITFTALILLAKHQTFGFEWFLRCLAGFFGGCLLAIGIQNKAWKIPRYASLVVLIGLVAYLQFKTHKSADVIMYFISALLIGMLVLSPNGILNKIFRLKMFVWLGEVSYSVYMTHYFIIFLVSNYFKRFLHYPDILNVQGAWVPFFPLAISIASLVLYIGVTLIISEFLYVYIENPFRIKTRQLANQYFDKESWSKTQSNYALNLR